MKITDLPQPFGFYRVLTSNDYLHFGYWPENNTHIRLSQAQKALSQLLLDRFPKPPKRILDVGCGLGAMAGQLVNSGFSVVAIAPEDSLITYAKQHHPGPEYLICGFLDDHPRLRPPECYDLILFQESLQYFPQLYPVFDKVKQLLEPSQGRMLFCDEVSYTSETRQHSAVHEAKEIERNFAEQGFFVCYHKRIGSQVAPNCEKVLQGFYDKRSEMLELFGPESESLIDHFTKNWKQRLTWYNNEQLGYEVWEIRPSDFQVQNYQEGDEVAIIKAFNMTFGVSRNLEHWYWKFQKSPFGGPYVSIAWNKDKTEVVAHYAGFPMPIWIENHTSITYQVGDKFTHPAYRGIGRGKTSLLGRVVRHFYRLHCEGHIPFFYGFATDKSKRFGQKFLRYYPTVSVYEWILKDDSLQKIRNKKIFINLLQGYIVTCTKQAGKWADSIFAQVKHLYNSWLVIRNQQYLKWRYQDNPDFCYNFFVVHHWGTPVGWWLMRVEGETLIVGDALFCDKTIQAPLAGLVAGLSFYQRKGVKIREVRGWFSKTPSWWNHVLEQLGFYSQRQHQNLELMIITFVDELEANKIGKNFYFTKGDSDLF
jgi:SAM-dependent methyltransferase